MKMKHEEYIYIKFMIHINPVKNGQCFYIGQNLISENE